MQMHAQSERVIAMSSVSSTYTSVRLRAEDYKRLKEVRRFVMRKGIDSIDWQELRRQNIVDPPDEDEVGEADELTMGMVVSLGSAALARLVSRAADR